MAEQDEAPPDLGSLRPSTWATTPSISTTDEAAPDLGPLKANVPPSVTTTTSPKQDAAWYDRPVPGAEKIPMTDEYGRPIPGSEGTMSMLTPRQAAELAAFGISFPVSSAAGALVAGLRAPTLVAQSSRLVQAVPELSNSLKVLGTLAGQVAEATPAERIAQAASPWLARGAQLGANALQGGIGALIAGGNPLTGAAVGGLSYPIGKGIEMLDKLGPFLHMFHLNALLRAPELVGRLIANNPTVVGAVGGNVDWGRGTFESQRQAQ